MNVWKYFEIAGQAAQKKEDPRFFWLGAVGIRSDRVIVSASNGPSYGHDRRVHAEYRLARKMDGESIVFVARIGRDTGHFRIARPCFDCEKVLKHKGVKKIFYTISHNEYGCIEF